SGVPTAAAGPHERERALRGVGRAPARGLPRRRARRARRHPGHVVDRRRRAGDGVPVARALAGPVAAHTAGAGRGRRGQRSRRGGRRPCGARRARTRCHHRGTRHLAWPAMSGTDPMKPRSYEVTDGYERAPARAMLRAIGMTDDDWDRSQIGVVSSWNEVTPCNLPLDRLAKKAKEGVRAAGGYPIEFTTIAVSDGISMGHEGMRASLVSREVIADSVETVMHAERFDGMVTFAGCDKSLPGMLMAAARINLPSVFLYGGTILPGHYKGQALDIVSVFEAVGAHAAGTIDDDELKAIECNACPSEGSCAGMFTANTMASVAEALGMSLPGSSSAPAPDPCRDEFAFESGQAVLNLLELGI